MGIILQFLSFSLVSWNFSKCNGVQVFKINFLRQFWIVFFVGLPNVSDILIFSKYYFLYYIKTSSIFYIFICLFYLNNSKYSWWCNINWRKNFQPNKYYFLQTFLTVVMPSFEKNIFLLWDMWFFLIQTVLGYLFFFNFWKILWEVCFFGNY